MRILVTGGAGFIGSHLVEHYHQQAEVVVLDSLRTGYPHNLEGLTCRFIEGCVTDRDAVETAMQGVDYVFHLAAMVSVPESMDHPTLCNQINTQGTLNVLEAAAEAGVRKCCFSSSSAIYGDNPVMPKTEDMRPEPCSPYAITKLDGEYYSSLFQRVGTLNTAGLRYFNVFGPRQDPGSAYAAAVPIFIARALANRPLTLFGDGEQTRDFIYVKDVVAANVWAAENEAVHGVYNVAYGQRITIKELAQEIISLTGSSSVIEHAPERPGDVKHSLASIDKITAAGFQPAGSLDEGLKATVDFFRD